MVEILCPHCDAEIELDDDSYGEFSCPHCDGEFEWGNPPKARRNSSAGSQSMNSTTAASHVTHGLGGIMLIFGMFSGWLVIGEFISATPFGMKASIGNFSATSGWFGFFGEDDSVLAMFGIVFMILAIIALISQLIHIAFRIILHLVDSGKLEVSMEMAYRSHQYRWHTSLIALASSIAGVVVMEIGLIIAFGMDLGFPRPGIFGFLLLATLGGQFVMMNEELKNE